MVNEQPDRIGYQIDFIDPLFAVALHIGLSEGIMQETWFKQWNLPQQAEFFNLLVIILGLFTVMFSWVGYHESIKQKPIKDFPRFLLDVIVVLLYASLLIKFKDLGAVLTILALIFGVYVLWDWAKVKEYSTTWGRREGVTLFWAVGFVALCCSHYYWQLFPESLALGFAYFGTVAYRINKNYSVSDLLYRRDAKG